MVPVSFTKSSKNTKVAQRSRSIHSHRTCRGDTAVRSFAVDFCLPAAQSLPGVLSLAKTPSLLISQDLRRDGIPRSGRTMRPVCGYGVMTMDVLHLLVALARACLIPRASLAAKNLVLRQQVVVLRRSVTRPKLRNRDRKFWVLLCRFWNGWRSSLYMLQPATVVRWQREDFKRYWRWQSRSQKPGAAQDRRRISPVDQADVPGGPQQRSFDQPLCRSASTMGRYTG